MACLHQKPNSELQGEVSFLLYIIAQKLEELKRSQEEELEERLDAGVKRILAANRRMAEELRLHVTVSSPIVPIQHLIGS